MPGATARLPIPIARPTRIPARTVPIPARIFAPFLARDTASPYVDNRPLLVAGKPETRKYKAVYVVGDDEVGQFSDEVTAVAQP